MSARVSGASAPAPETDLLPLPALRVLIAEDDAVVVLGLKMFLLEIGHQVVAAVETAPAAVDAAAALRPDLTLMDIRLANGTDGVDAAVEIWRRLSIPSIFITAYSDEETVERAKRAHPLDLLFKPVVPQKLRWSLKGAAALLQTGWQRAEPAAGRF